MPVLPAKFLLKVRRETTPLAGLKPWPIHGPQPLSRILAPAAMRSASAPFAASIFSTCLEPGATANSTMGFTCLPFRTRAVIMRSLKLEFVQLPTTIWFTLLPASSFMVFMLSGELGQAARGCRSVRLISITRSYFAPGSAFRGTKSCSRF